MQRVEKNIKLIYIQAIFRAFILAAPILVILMKSRGLSFSQIMMLQSIFALAGMAFEMPSGYFSDKLGRKFTIIVGSIFLTIGATLFAIAHSYTMFVAMELTFAFGYSMLSGTVSSLLYETLLALNREEEYAKIWGDLNFYSLISVAAASIIGGFIAKYSLDLTITLVIVPFFLATIFAFALVEPNWQKESKKASIKDDISDIKNILTGNMTIIYIVIFSATVFMFNQSVFWLYQPYLKESGIAIEYYGIIFASFQIVAALASKYTFALQKAVGLKRLIIIIGLGSPISIVLMGFNMHIWGFIIIYMQQIARSFKMVITSQLINEAIDSKFRATISSLESLVAKVLFAITVPIIGYASDMYSLSEVLIFLGVTGVITTSLTIKLLLSKSDSNAFEKSKIV